VNYQEFKIKMTGLESRRLAFKAKEQQLQSYLAKFDYYIHVCVKSYNLLSILV